MKKKLLFSLLYIFSQISFAQKTNLNLPKSTNFSQKNQLQPTATYTFTGLGDWSNSANWQGGIIPPNPLSAGDLITIAGTKPC